MLQNQGSFAGGFGLIGGGASNTGPAWAAGSAQKKAHSDEEEAKRAQAAVYIQSNIRGSMTRKKSQAIMENKPEKPTIGSKIRALAALDLRSACIAVYGEPQLARRLCAQLAFRSGGTFLEMSRLAAADLLKEDVYRAAIRGAEVDRMRDGQRPSAPACMKLLLHARKAHKPPLYLCDFPSTPEELRLLEPDTKRRTSVTWLDRPAAAAVPKGQNLQRPKLISALYLKRTGSGHIGESVARLLASSGRLEVLLGADGEDELDSLERRAVAILRGCGLGVGPKVGCYEAASRIQRAFRSMRHIAIGVRFRRASEDLADQRASVAAATAAAADEAAERDGRGFEPSAERLAGRELALRYLDDVDRYHVQATLQKVSRSKVQALQRSTMLASYRAPPHPSIHAPRTPGGWRAAESAALTPPQRTPPSHSARASPRRPGSASLHGLFAPRRIPPEYGLPMPPSPRQSLSPRPPTKASLVGAADGASGDGWAGALSEGEQAQLLRCRAILADEMRAMRDAHAAEIESRELEIERLRSRLLAHQIDPDAGEPARRRDPWEAWGQAGRGPSPSPPPPSSPSHSPLGWRPEVWGVPTSPRQIDGSWVPKFSASKVGRAQRPSGSP